VRLALAVPDGSRTMGRIADIWAEDARGHAELSVVNVPYATLLERVRDGSFDVPLLSFTTGRDVDLGAAFHSGRAGGQNLSGVSHPALDRALDAARCEPDRARRDALSRDVHRLLHDLAPYAFIVSDTRVGLVRSGVGGIAVGPFGPVARHLGKRAPGDRR
jgi:ABC-type transport system substrate-binding protein